MRARLWMGWLMAAFVAVSLASCTAPSVVPSSKPLPEGHDFDGVWYSEQFDHLHLKQSGSKVQGIFTHDRGGRINGTREGNILRFEWIEPGDKEKAIREQSGRGYFQLVVEGGKTMLKGKWGYDEHRTNGGPWNAEYIRPLEEGDPLTLEALHDRRR